MNRLKRNNKGFSLIELVVTIAIMAVLAGVLIPSMVTASNESRMKSDESVMNHLTETYKSAIQEHQNYYYFSRVMQLLEDDKQQIFFWYDVDNDGNVSYRAVNLVYPVAISESEKQEIDSWVTKLRKGANDYVNGSYEIPKLESKTSCNKSYVIAVSATGREYLVNVQGAWDE